MKFNSYDDYLRTEWVLFSHDVSRAEVSRQALSGIRLDRVLDIGCGAGQELIPFSSTSFSVGMDIAETCGKVGRELFERHDPKARIAFVRAASEDLPFATSSFDAAICRLALPYTHNLRTLREISRILKPGGLLILKIHHWRFYLDECRTALSRFDVLAFVHSVRVLTAGTIYHLTGKQVRTAVLSRETFQTEWLLRRELNRTHLSLESELPGSNPLTPAFLIRRETPN